MPTLSVIIPVYNEAGAISATLGALASEIRSAPLFRAELIVVDDGSTDATADAVSNARVDVPTHLITQPNSGRLAARRAGLGAAKGEYTLFLDSRVAIVPGSLAFVSERLAAGELAWNAHVHIESVGNMYGHFWSVLTELAFAAYFANPRTTSFTDTDFDLFPKGTTCFLAPSPLLREAFGRFTTSYRDERHANDDTPILRWLAAQMPIHISPNFACVYAPRSTLAGFLRHAYHRGIVFLDGHGHRPSRFFPAVVAFYPVSIAATGLAARRPLRAASLAAATVVVAGAVAVLKRRTPEEVLAFAVLTPVYAAAHGLGMWRGIALAIVKRTTPRNI